MKKSRITITDLARITGFSKTTISHVLNNTKGARVRAKTRELIVQAAREHNYVPNFFARNIIRGRTRYVGFLTHSLEEACLSGELLGAEEGCRPAGCSLMIINAGEAAKAEVEVIEAAVQRGIEGLYADRLDNPREAGERLSQFGILLVVGSKSEPEAGIDCVFEDEEGGFDVVGERLRGLGHDRAAVVDLAGAQREGRRSSARRALGKRGVETRDVLVNPDAPLFDQVRSALGGEERGAAAVAVCLDVSLAVGLLTHLTAAGRRVPEDISIVSAGAVAPPDCLRPRLACLRRPLRLRALQAVAHLVGRLDGEEAGRLSLAVAPKFVDGESLGPAPRG
jgi:LacI family transcriptional regulator